MPKIRCRSCEAVLNLPEKALGKTISCPKCKNKMKVPSGKKSSAKPAKKQKSSKPAADDPFGFGDLDDMAMEDQDDQICPYCAAELDEGDPVCRSCGMNVETGQMDRKEKKRRSRRGPDPSKFIKGAWSESWAFLKKEAGLAVRTGTAWTLFSVLTMACGYMGFIYITDQMPPKVFWIFMTCLMVLGIPGWFWILSLKIIEATRLREKFRADRIHFEFFTSIASGIRTVFWPIIMMGPVSPLLAIFWALQFDAINDPTAAAEIAANDPMFQALLGVFLGLIPLIMLPIAMIHMTARHSYKGWIFFELVKDFFKNFAWVMYYHIVALIVVLPAAALAGGIFYLIQDVNPFHSEVVNKVTKGITMWLINIVGMNAGPDSMVYTMLLVPLNFGAAFLLFAPIAYTAAFPAVFLMKANGLLGYYCQESIETVDRMKSDVPATFWIRYLSRTVDSLLFPLSCFIVTSNKRAMTGAWMGIGLMVLIYLFNRSMFEIVLGLWLLYSNWMYWVVQESSELRSTIGKDAFGLSVLTDDGKKLTNSQAFSKWLLRLVFDLLLGIPYLMAAFSPDKKALHDSMTKTKVVWKGDR